MDLFKSADFTKHVEELMEQWHAPGLAIAVVQGNDVASRGFGTANFNPDKPVTADTLFDIASSSKSLTAASVALLVADDDRFPHVKWNATMASLLPDDFVMSKERYTEDVTVEDILSHRTGLPGHDLSYLGNMSAKPDTPQSVTRNLRNLEISEPIRTKYMYCNLMFTVATYLVEQMSGQTFEQFLHERFFSPLNMNSTHLQPDAVKAAGLGDRLATGQLWSEDQQTYTPVKYQQAPEAQGAGSITTSANDYIKWVKALINQEAPITKEIYDGITKLRTVVPDEPDELDPYTSAEIYGAGLSSYWYRGHRVITHDGGISGYGSQHFLLPDFKLGGVVLGNSESGANVGDILMHELIDQILEVPPHQRPDWNERARDRKLKADEKDANSGHVDVQPLETPLSTYTGQYWNKGYHAMTVEVKDDALFMDATDRSMAFTLTFQHRRNGTEFIAQPRDYFDGSNSNYKFDVEFRFEDDVVVQMGISLEEEMHGLIWFDKVESAEESHRTHDEL